MKRASQRNEEPKRAQHVFPAAEPSYSFRIERMNGEENRCQQRNMSFLRE